jgi:hypothetical protein
LDERLLAVDWGTLRMGAWQLDSASANDRRLDGRTLGTSVGWLDLDRRSLAVSEFTIDKIDFWVERIDLRDVAVTALI